MNQRIKRLNKILEYKRGILQQKRIQFQKEQQLFVIAKQKYQQLTFYRCEYVNKVNELGKQSVIAQTFQKYFQFIDQLDGAIDKQIQHITSASSKKQQVYEDYLTTKRTVEAMEKVLECAIKEQSVWLDKMQQKENDEYSQNQWYSNRDKDE
jgi:flagellar export protein FliJ